MSKTVSFGKKRTVSNAAEKLSDTESRYKDGADDWVGGAEKGAVAQPEKEDSLPKMKRLTIDISEEHHRLLKMVAVQKGSTIADILRKTIARQVKSVT